MATLCPKCKGSSVVKDSRASPRGTRRRRACQNAECGYKWTTIEIVGSRIPRNMRFMGTHSVEDALSNIESQTLGLLARISELKKIFMLEREEHEHDAFND
jgi:hypothetical protein